MPPGCRRVPTALGAQNPVGALCTQLRRELLSERDGMSRVPQTFGTQYLRAILRGDQSTQAQAPRFDNPVDGQRYQIGRAHV